MRTINFLILFVCSSLNPVLSSANLGGYKPRDVVTGNPSAPGCLHMSRGRSSPLPVFPLRFDTDERTQAFNVEEVRPTPGDPGGLRITVPVATGLALGLGFADPLPSGSGGYRASRIYFYDPDRKGWGMTTRSNASEADWRSVRTCVNAGGKQHDLEVTVREGDVIDGDVILGARVLDDGNIQAIVADQAVVERLIHQALELEKRPNPPLPQELADRQRRLLVATRLITIQKDWVMRRTLESVRTGSPSPHQWEIRCRAEKLAIVPVDSGPASRLAESCLNLPVVGPAPTVADPKHDLIQEE